MKTLAHWDAEERTVSPHYNGKRREPLCAACRIGWPLIHVTAHLRGRPRPKRVRR